MLPAISVDDLYEQLGLQSSPLVIDVRRDGDFSSEPRMIPGALRGGDASLDGLARILPKTRTVCVHCAHGGEISHQCAEKLAALGFSICILAGGFAAWIAASLPTVKVRADLKMPGGSRWVTRERPKIDRVACPWLVRRFIDPQALFFYTAPHRVRGEAQALGAEPYDIADVTFSHRGERCSFDAFLAEFDLHDPTIDAVADIVRAADTATLERSPQAPGLLAIALGMSANQPDDILLLEQAMPIYDALYAWCKTARHERHGWPQSAP